MAMVICNECKACISTSANSCIHCGARKKKTSGYAIAAAAFIGLTLVANTWLLWRLTQAEGPSAAIEITQAAGNSQ
ncbi:MAG TPA: hypothetical protein VN205_11625 [Thermomonas sp.]|nr:hypothetical protein [Thermomonas sp.]